jgi:hypothetical protein
MRTHRILVSFCCFLLQGYMGVHLVLEQEQDDRATFLRIRNDRLAATERVVVRTHSCRCRLRVTRRAVGGRACRQTIFLNRRDLSGSRPGGCGCRWG